ncbi:MAG: Veg family protein [Firmicutes bacterium]|nr:Veg family protein [Bacillota bacterium]
MTKKNGLTIDMIRQKIDEMVGQDIKMQVCRGRKQVHNYRGVIENAFSRVFVVRINDTDALTYSYSDILCGEVQVDAM